jgi:hypothetical protein
MFEHTKRQVGMAQVALDNSRVALEAKDAQLEAKDAELQRFSKCKTPLT